MRIMIYNIHGAIGTDGHRDYKRVGALLKDEKVDIALIQEVDTPPLKFPITEVFADLKAEHFEHHVLAPTIQNSGRVLGNAVLSRFPILEHQVHEITHPGRERRNILQTVIETDQGPLRAINTHFGLSLSERRMQLRELHKVLSADDSLPFVCGGDLNIWEPAPGLKKLNRDFHSPPTGWSFPTMLPLFRLDRAWCKPNAVIQEAKVLKDERTRVYSDHFPLILDISF
jgi:endonuclease/exonuclease/phosphatase family metal-dependent hydrolase